MSILEKIIVKNESKYADVKALFNNTSNNAAESFVKIFNYIDMLEKENSRLNEKVKTFNKDEEIQNMKLRVQELEKETRMATRFCPTELEQKVIDAWINSHNETHKGYGGTIGGRYSYRFTPTSIGTFGEVKCSCGAHISFREP